MTEPCKAWQGGCKDAYAAGRNDLIRELARRDDCCPPMECPGEGSYCIECWEQYLNREEGEL